MDLSENFFVLLNKPKYVTSFKALYELKRSYKKVGHSGTLDPYAEGLLVAGVNRALKFFQFLPKEKEYVFDITFGFSTNSDDLDGVVVERKETFVNIELIEAVLPVFIGKIVQVPSAFSAVKINGVRAYKLARQEVEFEMLSREVEVFYLKLIGFNDNVARFVVGCSKGTYVRSLARDICKAMGVIGCVSFLQRTKSDGFTLDLAGEKKFSLDCILEFYPFVLLNDVAISSLRNGAKVHYMGDVKGKILCVKNDCGAFLGLTKLEGGMLFSLCMV